MGTKSYLGNPNLKGIGVSVDWTPEAVKEYKKCMESPLYFIKNYVQIVNVDRGLVMKSHQSRGKAIDVITPANDPTNLLAYTKPKIPPPI